MRPGQKLKLGGTILVTACVGALVLYRWSLSQRLDAALEAIRAQGYPVTLEELDAWYVEPPAGENAAEVLLEAVFGLTDCPDESTAFVPFAGEAEVPPLPRRMPPGMRDHIELYLAANLNALEALHAASVMPDCRWPVDLLEGGTMPLPHLDAVRQGVDLLALEALLRAENGDGEPAGASLMAAVGLARSLAHEPIVLSQLTRTVCLRRVAQVLERVLTGVSLPDEQMATLGAELLDAENPEFHMRALAGERCWEIDALGVGFSEETGGVLLPGFSNNPRGALYQSLRRPLGIASHDFLAYVDVTSASIDGLRRPVTEREAAFEQAMTRFAGREEIFGHACSHAGVVSIVSRDLAQLTRCLRIARLALAAERYRVTHGDWPASAELLVPDLIEAIPIDPYVGQSLRFECLSTGYEIRGASPQGQSDLAFTVERE